MGRIGEEQVQQKANSNSSQFVSKFTDRHLTAYATPAVVKYASFVMSSSSTRIGGQVSINSFCQQGLSYSVNRHTVKIYIYIKLPLKNKRSLK